MGKAAERRKRRRQMFLSKLAEENPGRFEYEWDKRLKSWADEIWFFGRKGRIKAPILFSIADRAKKVLSDCGEKAMRLQFKETKDILENECCQALSPHIGREIYRINQEWKDRKT